MPSEEEERQQFTDECMALTTAIEAVLAGHNVATVLRVLLAITGRAIVLSATSENTPAWLLRNVAMPEIRDAMMHFIREGATPPKKELN